MLHGIDGDDRGIQPLRRPDGTSLWAWRADPVLSALPHQFALSRVRGRPLILAVAGVFVGLVVLIVLRYDALWGWLYDGKGGVIQQPGKLPVLVNAETGPSVVIGAAIMILICFAVALAYHWQGGTARWQSLETGRRLHTKRRFVTGGIEDAAKLHTLFGAGDFSSLPTFTTSRRGAIRVTTHTDSSDKQVFLTIALGKNDHVVAAPLITLRGPEATRFGLQEAPPRPNRTPLARIHSPLGRPSAVRQQRDGRRHVRLRWPHITGASSLLKRIQAEPAWVRWRSVWIRTAIWWARPSSRTSSSRP